MVSYQEVKIAPSVLAADFLKLGEQVKAAEKADADWIHIDVMDGRFVPNITMGPLVVKAIRRATDLPLDVHLMVIEPERYIEKFAEAGASNISVHLETSPHLHRTLQQIRDIGCRVGVAINPHTPASALSEVITMVDLINVMTVNPGFGGQSFIMNTKSKIAKLRAMVGDIKGTIDIEVDGGVTDETASHAVQAGANVLVTGTSIFEHPDGIEAGITALRKSLEDAKD